MPALEITHLYQKVLYWAQTGYDDHGQPTTSPTPTETRARWSDVEAEVLDPKGNTIRVDTSAIVFVDIPVDSHMWVAPLTNTSALSQWNALGSGLSDDRLFSVKSVNKTPDIRNRAQQRTLGLMRLHRHGTN